MFLFTLLLLYLILHGAQCNMENILLSLQKQLLEVVCKKKMFLKISQILQENTCGGVFF